MSDGKSVAPIQRDEQRVRQEFYRRAAAASLAPLWEVLHGLVAERPHSPCTPALWRYRQVRPYLLEACDLISTEEAERRVLVLENPGLPGQSRITRNLFAGLQIIRPGEIAPAHRHVASALRFIIEGHNAYTAVAGERTLMEPGDFVITPSWSWHDHGNESDQVMVWLDGLDMHIVNLCDASFRENYPARAHPQTRPMGAAMAEAGCNLLPIDFKSSSATTPIFNYPYRATRPALESLRRFREPDACHGFKMAYVNPLTGGSAMPTMSTAMQLLPAGFATDDYRCTASTVFTVVEGSGWIDVQGTRMEWTAHDVFVVPSWHGHRLHAHEDAVLFSYSDRVVQEKLDFFREQRGEA